MTIATGLLVVAMQECRHHAHLVRADVEAFETRRHVSLQSADSGRSNRRAARGESSGSSSSSRTAAAAAAAVGSAAATLAAAAAAAAAATAAAGGRPAGTSG